MVKFVYAFTQIPETKQDVVAICPKDYWEKEGDIRIAMDDEEMGPLSGFLTTNGLYPTSHELGEVLFGWPEDADMATIARALAGDRSFEASETLMSFLNASNGADTTTTKVEPVPDPIPPGPPKQMVPHTCPLDAIDCMKVQIGNHVINVPMDVNTALVLAQVFQTYAQYQIVAKSVQQPVQQPVQPDKQKTTPAVPESNPFSLPNSMRGEMLSVHNKTVIKITQSGMLIAETRACDSQKEAYEIAGRFARMIPGLVKPGEIVRK